MRVKKFFFILIAAAVAMVACKENGKQGEQGPDEVNLLSEAVVNVGGDSEIITVKFSSNVAWTAESAEEFIALKDKSGESGDAIELKATIQSLPEDKIGRTGSILIKAGNAEASVVIMQGKVFYITPSRLEIGLEGGKAEFEVITNLEYRFDLKANRKTLVSFEQNTELKGLEHLSNLKNEASALKRVVAENDRLRTEIEAIDIARDTMTRLSTTIRDSFGLYLNRNASELIAGITGGIYTSLSIDQDLNVSLNTEKKLVPLEQVSSGTMDQVYLALRLASADLMRQDGVQLPLFLDDSFVNYDEDRLRTVLRWLPETFPDRQILVFSCHRREAQLLSANMIPYTLTEIA